MAILLQMAVPAMLKQVYSVLLIIKFPRGIRRSALSNFVSKSIWNSSYSMLVNYVFVANYISVQIRWGGCLGKRIKALKAAHGGGLSSEFLLKVHVYVTVTCYTNTHNLTLPNPHDFDWDTRILHIVTC